MTQNTKKKESVHVMCWPPQCPDLNLTETMWDPTNRSIKDQNYDNLAEK
jgi:hypothetical protein